ncbi:MAG TPA: hypothetical protein VN767_26810 [Streptosporangiaceae bacterium]|nr:hypothetical protein [Streptosporangiaceae bacterium]
METRLSSNRGSTEVEELRSEITDLKSQLAEAREQVEEQARRPRARRGPGWRGPVAAILIVVGCVLAPVSVLGVWTANQVSDTSRYVENMAPLISEPAVQRALTDKITTEISRQIDVQGVAKQAAAQLSKQGLTRLSSLLSTFSGSIASGVNGFIHTIVAKIVASPVVANLWKTGNRVAHTQLVRALSGQSSALTISNGKVVIGLGPFIDEVKRRLAARGLTLVNSLPPINPTFPLFDAKYLVKARTLYSLLTTLKWALPLTALILLAAGVYVAKRHRRALVGAGLGVAGSMVVLAIGIAIARAIYLNKIPATFPADAAAVAFDDIVRFIREGLRVLFVLGLVVAFAGFFTGSSITAVRTRNAFKTGFGKLRGTGEAAGLNTGPFGTWVYQYRTPLRVVAVVLATLIFAFWGDPTGLVVFVIALLLLVVLGIIELIGRPSVRT